MEQVTPNPLVLAKLLLHMSESDLYKDIKHDVILKAASLWLIKALRMNNVLRGYETWEANLIMDGDWRNAQPKMTQALFDELLELQKARNEARVVESRFEPGYLPMDAAPKDRSILAYFKIAEVDYPIVIRWMSETGAWACMDGDGCYVPLRRRPLGWKEL